MDDSDEKLKIIMYDYFVFRMTLPRILSPIHKYKLN